eukprot:g1139.t1
MERSMSISSTSSSSSSSSSSSDSSMSSGTEESSIDVDKYPFSMSPEKRVRRVTTADGSDLDSSSSSTPLTQRRSKSSISKDSSVESSEDSFDFDHSFDYNTLDSEDDSTLLDDEYLFDENEREEDIFGSQIPPGLFSAQVQLIVFSETDGKGVDEEDGKGGVKIDSTPYDVNGQLRRNRKLESKSEHRARRKRAEKGNFVFESDKKFKLDIQNYMIEDTMLGKKADWLQNPTRVTSVYNGESTFDVEKESKVLEEKLSAEILENEAVITRLKSETKQHDSDLQEQRKIFQHAKKNSRRRGSELILHPNFLKSSQKINVLRSQLESKTKRIEALKEDCRVKERKKATSKKIVREQEMSRMKRFFLSEKGKADIYDDEERGIGSFFRIMGEMPGLRMNFGNYHSGYLWVKKDRTGEKFENVWASMDVAHMQLKLYSLRKTETTSKDEEKDESQRFTSTQENAMQEDAMTNEKDQDEIDEDSILQGEVATAQMGDAGEPEKIEFTKNPSETDRDFLRRLFLEILSEEPHVSGEELMTEEQFSKFFLNLFQAIDSDAAERAARGPVPEANSNWKMLTPKERTEKLKKAAKAEWKYIAGDRQFIVLIDLFNWYDLQVSGTQSIGDFFRVGSFVRPHEARFTHVRTISLWRDDINCSIDLPDRVFPEREYECFGSSEACLHQDTKTKCKEQKGCNWLLTRPLQRSLGKFSSKKSCLLFSKNSAYKPFVSWFKSNEKPFDEMQEYRNEMLRARRALLQTHFSHGGRGRASLESDLKCTIFAGYVLCAESGWQLSLWIDSIGRMCTDIYEFRKKKRVNFRNGFTKDFTRKFEEEMSLVQWRENWLIGEVEKQKKTAEDVRNLLLEDFFNFSQKPRVEKEKNTENIRRPVPQMHSGLADDDRLNQFLLRPWIQRTFRGRVDFDCTGSRKIENKVQFGADDSDSAVPIFSSCRINRTQASELRIAGILKLYIPKQDSFNKRLLAYAGFPWERRYVRITPVSVSTHNHIGDVTTYDKIFFLHNINIDTLKINF